MPRYKCNSCGGVYVSPQSSGALYFHTCPPEEVEPGTFAATGAPLTPEKRTPRASVRNENIQPGVLYVEGKALLEVEDPTRNVASITLEVDSVIISEGKGRTLDE